ncbi:MAG: hypothetical protein KDA87_24580 [Planctomycetales bacterium]|nr:hypothetical protein [Planctomycetales bacterium]
MKRLSSKLTMVYKQGIRAVLVIAILALVIVLHFNAASRSMANVICWLIAFTIAWGIQRLCVGNPIDEVWDDGDVLLCTNGRQTYRIPISEIANVGYDVMLSPPKMSLDLLRDSPFGRRIEFLLPWWTFLFQKHAQQLAEDLIRRRNLADAWNNP